MAQDIQPITGTNAKIAARLCNFVTGEAFLLPAHVNFLDQEVAPVIRGMQGPWVDIYSYASRRGDAAFNQTLSERRINAVKQRISQYANRVNFQIQKAFGEGESGPNETDNSGYFRAVEIYVFANKPPAPKPNPVILPGSTRFKIRVAGGLSAAIPILKGPQADGYMFQIVDVKNAKSMFFSFTAIGVAIPSLPGLPVSFTGVGPLADFSTTAPVQLFQFEGPCQLFQDWGATIGPFSTPYGKMRLSFDTNKLLFDVGARVIPSIVPMEGGPGLQTPSTGSASPGVLVRQSREVPFTG